MNVRSVAIGVVLLLVLGSAAYAQTVSWLPGSTAPRQWSIDPVNPTPSDVITFSGPTAVYSNSCIGERSLGGTPQILIDSKARVVTLWFKGPVPEVCTMIYSPVAGLQGELGPLEAGDWVFTCLARDLNFQVPFTVRDKFAYHVDADAPGPVHNGRSWETAMLTLQDALAVAGSGDEIFVAEGVYKPDQGGTATLGDRAASFVLQGGLIIRGGFAGYGLPRPDTRDLALYATILSGDLRDDDQWGTLNLGENSYHVVTGAAGESPALLDGVVITGGNANGAYPHHYGGGLYNPAGKLNIANTTFRTNTGVWGGALMNLAGSVTLVNCQLTGNRSLMLGGGLYNYEGDVTLHNCRIVGNTADYAEIAGGAAVYNLDGTLTVRSSTVADNRSPSGKAIANFTWASPAGVRVKVANSILFNGGNEIWSNNRDVVEVTYSDVQGGWSGAGNISVDPQFTTLGTRNIEGEWFDGDYRLKTSSPAIDVGSNAAVPTDVLDLDANGNVAEPLPFDLDNEARVEGAQVDMGAYEQLAQKPTPALNIDLLACVSDECFKLEPDPAAPALSNTFIGRVDVDIPSLGFQGKLSATVTAKSAAGGTWTGGLTPEIVGPGASVVTLWVKGENLDLAPLLLISAKSVQVAEVRVYVVPIP